jgi:hypothetical protein
MEPCNCNAMTIPHYHADNGIFAVASDAGQAITDSQPEIQTKTKRQSNRG